jgi:hypothetical protein
MRSFALFFIILLVVFPAPSSLLGKGSGAVYPAVERIVVVGDIHGDLQKLTEILEVAGLINKRGRWTGGDTHLVQLGDVPDRGADSKEIVRFLKTLERDAQRRGGRVHVLIGNHDAMNVYGDLRYVTKEEYAAFEKRDSMQRLERLYEMEKAVIQANYPEERWPPFDEGYREQWFEERPPGYVEHRINWKPDGDIGKWVMKNNAVVKVGRILFVHAGIGPNHVDWSIDQINETLRQELLLPPTDPAPVARDGDGPLWYRGLALNKEDVEAPHLERVLEAFGVDRIVVGHTVTSGVILPRFGARVLLVDVGLSRYFGDNSACLVIEGEELFAQHRGGRVPVPTDTDPDTMIQYLTAVAELEPANTTIRRRIEAFQRDKLINGITGKQSAAGK